MEFDITPCAERTGVKLHYLSACITKWMKRSSLLSLYLKHMPLEMDSYYNYIGMSYFYFYGWKVWIDIWNLMSVYQIVSFTTT